MNDYFANIFFIDVPAQPGKPTIEGYDSDRCDLQWKIPSSDGGIKITEYIIQYSVRNIILKSRYCIAILPKFMINNKFNKNFRI